MRTMLKKILRRAGFRKTGAASALVRRVFAGWVDAIGLIFFPRAVISGISAGSIRKILVIRIDRVGDLVLSTPALRALRRCYPAAKIHLFVSPYAKEVVVTNPNVDRILLYRIDPIEHDYDIAIALHPGFRTNFLAYRSGARYRFGYAGAGGSFFLTRALPDDRAVRVRHEVESAMEIAALAGCALDERALEVFTTVDGETFADSFFELHGLSGEPPVIGIHPGSSQEYIRWKKAGYARVADELARIYSARIILFGGPGEEALVGEVQRLMREQAIVVTGITLTRLISLIKRCRLFIGNSTGPMHIAAALNVPVVALFGPVHPLDSYQEWGPWNKNSVIVSKRMKCPRCHPTDCTTFNCMQDIAPEDVLDAAKRLLSGGEPSLRQREKPVC